MKRILLSLAGFVTLFGLMATPVQSRVQAAGIFQTTPQPEAKMFSGRIVKSGKGFVLSDSSTKIRDTLDDPRKAKPFEGKTVKVTGTLYVASNLIHVQAIQDIV